MSREVTVWRTTYPPHVKGVNRILGWLEHLPGRSGMLDSDDVFRAARRSTGYADWGDERFLPMLENTLELGRDPRMTPLARMFIRQSCEKAVSNRLRVEAYRRRHPEVASIPVRRPLFILGFPRTGTTLLQNLLSLHRDCRALAFWELHSPVPLGLEYRPGERERRRWAARGVLALAHVMAPEQPYIHAVGADTPEECWQLMANTLAVLNFDLQSGRADFGDRLLQQDMAWVYAEYRRMLQILAHQRPADPFVLKCPEHLWFLDALLDVFPDAGILWTHRDPFGSIASYCSMISLNYRMLFGRIDRLAVGDHITQRFQVGVERAMAARDRRGSDSFFDVHFQRVVEDPVGLVLDIARWHGLPEDPGHEVAMREYLSQERTDARGSHRYDPALFGLRREAVHRAFRTYMDRFHLAGT